MYYTINEEVARVAHNMRSLSDYKEGSTTASYRAQVDDAARILEDVKSECSTEYQRDRADYLFDQYAKTLADAINRDNEIGTRCPSVLVSGAGNFPVRKKQKQVAAWDKNRETWDRAEQYLKRLSSVHLAPVASDDPEALDVLRDKLEKLEAFQQRMKEANAAIRLKDHAKGDTRLQAMGYTPQQILDLRRPDYCGRVGYPSYMLSNNNSTIKRTRDRLQQLEAAKAAAPAEIQAAGYTYKEDTEAMRVQFFFDGKPDDETRALLKSHGFRWAPSVGAWQRQLTDNGKMAARQVMKALEG